MAFSAPKELLSDALGALKRTTTSDSYVRYLTFVHFNLSRLIDSGGASRYRSLDKTDKNFSALASQSEEASKLLVQIGFEEQVHSLVLNDFDSNQAAIILLCEMALEDLTIAKSDPASLVPVSSTTPRSALIAYMAYHYYIRTQLLTLHTIPHLLPATSTDIQLSMIAINSAAQHLGVFADQSVTRALWDGLTNDIVTLIQGTCSRDERYKIGCTLRETGDEMIKEIMSTLDVDPRLEQIWFHAQNLQAILGFTFTGSLLNRDAVNTYLSISARLRPDCMTDEYIARMDTSCEIVNQSLSYSLDDEQIRLLHATVQWQAEHFLRQFRVEAFEASSTGTPWDALRSMDSGVSADFAEILRDNAEREQREQQEQKPKVDRPESCGGDGNSDDLDSAERLERLEAEVTAAATLGVLRTVEVEIGAAMKPKVAAVAKLKDEIRELKGTITDSVPEFIRSILDSTISEKEHELEWACKAVRQFQTLQRMGEIKVQAFQMRLDGLDVVVMRECLCGFVESFRKEMGLDQLVKIVAAMSEVVPGDVVWRSGMRERFLKMAEKNSAT